MENMNQAYVPACADGRSPLKRIAAIHDLSSFGRCALTVIMPTLSAMGYQVVPVPTCLLSSHTGGFTDMSFLDLTDNMEDIHAHFDRLDLKFDAIYSGFLGNHKQIELVKRFIERFGDKDTLVFVDPVMGDGGELYSTYTEELMRGMINLCHGADVITPNLPEACFLTGTPYRPTEGMSEREIENLAEELIEKLLKFGKKKIAVTGFEMPESVITFGTDKSGIFTDKKARHAASYPGTGDIFASTLLGYFLDGNSFEDATHKACDFTAKVIEYTMQFPTPHRDGVMLEPCLKFLFQERTL